MFRLFQSKKPFEPLNQELRTWIEDVIHWLSQEFPTPSIQDRKTIIPTPEYFPFKWSSSQETAINTLEVVAPIMEVIPEDIDLQFFESDQREIDTGTTTLFLQHDSDYQSAAGLYYGKNENDKYLIELDMNNLKDAESTIATIAHELAHVKLLGENRIEENDELLTDLTTVFFGFGIFGANSCFQFRSSKEKWEYRHAGYLKQ